jgi:beta-lactamase class A
MRSLAIGIWAQAKARPRAVAAAGLLLGAAAIAGGWVVASHHSPVPEVALTSLKTALHIHAGLPPPAPAELQARLDALAAAYREPVGIAVVDVKDRWTAAVDGDSAYPQQSVSKLWVAMSVLDAVDHGGLSLDQAVVVTRDDRSVFYQPLGERVGEKGFATTLHDLLRRALTESDNAANDKLMREVGGAGAVTDALAEKGLDHIAVGAYERELQARTAGLEWRPEYAGWRFKEARSKLPDSVRDQALAAYLADPPDGASPSAVAHALAALARGDLLSKASSETMLTLMGEARTGRMRLRGGLPPGWKIAHKTGTGPDWRGASVGINDVGLLTAPDGRLYAVAVMMRQTRKPVPQRLALMQAVTRAVADSWRARDTAPGPAEGRQLAAGPQAANDGL